MEEVTYFKDKPYVQRKEINDKLRLTFPDKIPILFYPSSNSQITKCENEK